MAKELLPEKKEEQGGTGKRILAPQVKKTENQAFPKAEHPRGIFSKLLGDER